MFAKILLALDSSQAAQKAAAAAVGLAEKYNARLFLLSVVQLPDYGATIGEVQETQEEGKKFYKDVQDPVIEKASAKGLEVKGEIAYGHPAEILARFAKHHDVDLIVIGYKGTSNVRRLLVGSVSEKVTRLAPCSVMVVR